MDNNLPITCTYGANNSYIDVTHIVKRFFLHHDKLIFHKGYKNLNKFFGDPCFGSVKTLKIVYRDKEYLISENDDNEYMINISTGKLCTSDDKHLDDKHLDDKHLDDKHLDNKHLDDKHLDEKYFDKTPLITFIIPTVGRQSLIKTLRSLEFQENPQWEAIVVFDGVEPSSDVMSKITTNPKIRHIVLKEKIGSGINSGGLVRNEAFKHVTTEWVGFVDDDDILSSKYVQRFCDEKKENPDVECFIFRMYFAFQVIPDRRAGELERGNVGISFCFKTELFNDGVKFEPSQYEDIALLTKIRERHHKIMISPYVTYFVKGFMLTPETISVLEKFNRKLFIN